MLHLPGLPGTPGHSGHSVDELAERAAVDALILAEAGFDRVLLQNSLDRPTRERVDVATVAQLAVIGAAVRQRCPIPLGINLHKNDGPAAIAVAHAVGAAFVRVKVYTGAVLSAEGLVEGCAAETLAIRRRLGAEIDIWADVHELTSRPLEGDDLESAAVDAAEFGAADALILTRPTVVETLEVIEQLRRRLPSTPLLVGGGVDAATVVDAIAYSDGVIVGRALKGDGAIGSRVDRRAAEDIVAARTRYTAQRPMVGQ